MIDSCTGIFQEASRFGEKWENLRAGRGPSRVACPASPVYVREFCPSRTLETIGSQRSVFHQNTQAFHGFVAIAITDDMMTTSMM